ncbi:uncharacterized protein LOC141852119 [Brevipalpus obovatus]|uniref:uncharacterized protein LOC141852119 n=1 Tax=Brevipalpus obovatus TaxID=246614 RepID=UPI003D9E0FD4
MPGSWNIWARFSKFLPAWQVITSSLLQMAFLLNVIYAHIHSDHEIKQLDKLAPSDNSNNNVNRLKVPTILANVSTGFLFHPIESSETATNIMKLESGNASSQHHSSRSLNGLSNNANSTSTSTDLKLPDISVNNSTDRVEDKSKRHISDNGSKQSGKIGLYHRQNSHHHRRGWADEAKLYKVKIRCKSVARYSYLHQPVWPELSCKKSKKNNDKPKHISGWMSTSDTHERPDRVKISTNEINSIDYEVINSHNSRE